MSVRRVVAVVALLAVSSVANGEGMPRPDALLMVDQHREAIIERVVKAWPEALTGEQTDVLRKTLAGLRADRLLAISISPGLDSLLGVLQGVDRIEATKGSLVANKALGDINADVVYTPITPCRIVDTRLGAGGALHAGDTRNWLASNPGGTFAAQGGSNTNCTIPVKPAAVLVNLTVANTQSGPAFLTAWPFNQAKPLASSLNWVAPGTQLANAIILPLCTGGGCASDWSLFASSGTDLIVDVMGFFAAPTSGYADVLPPTVVIDAPATASASTVRYSITFADNVGLAYWLSADEVGQASSTMLFDAGTKTATLPMSIGVPLDKSATRTFMAVDNAGNISKAKLAISAPPTAVTFGEYSPVAATYLPADFDCFLPNMLTFQPWYKSSENGTQVVNTRLGPPSDWSAAGGFKLGASIVWQATSYATNWAHIASESLAPLDATTFALAGGANYYSGYDSGGTFWRADWTYIGSVVVLGGTPPQVEVRLTKRCNFNNAGWFSGSTATFIAKLN